MTGKGMGQSVAEQYYDVLYQIMAVTIHKSQQELQEWTTEERMQPAAL